jgi:hypothetical protein
MGAEHGIDIVHSIQPPFQRASVLVYNHFIYLIISGFMIFFLNAIYS